MNWKIFAITISTIYSGWYLVNILLDLLKRNKASPIKNASEWNVSNLLDDEAPPKKVSEKTVFSTNHKIVQNRKTFLKADNTEIKYKEKQIKM